jgi:hypothetical protein
MVKKIRVKQIWSDAVWSKIIAAAIISIAGGIYSYANGWWSTIDEFIQSPPSVPNKTVAALGIISLFSYLFSIVLVVFWKHSSLDDNSQKDIPQDMPRLRNEIKKRME